MKRLVSPPKDQHDKLRQPLTAGEKKVFDFFDRLLPLEWEIYIQPHLNGLRPDFVLLNPNAGIAVFEVKDWNLRAMRYQVKERKGKAPKLVGSIGEKTFSLQHENPIEKTHRYKEEIFNLYCPRLQQRTGFSVITAGVIFPFANELEVKKLFEQSLSHRRMLTYPQYSPISGFESLSSDKLSNVFPESSRTSSQFMSKEMADDLRSWLVEPDFSATQRLPLELDSRQKELATSRTPQGYRRLKGPAGSGKSLILAARVAELLKEDKTVLVVTFNITLLHYLKDLTVRASDLGGKTRKIVTWLNFHNWCRRVCSECDFLEEYRSLWREGKLDKTKREQILKFDIPALVSSILSDPETAKMTQTYDAILVDEGQDFFPSWWDTLRKVSRPGGEMLLVADATQDIYESAKSWTDEAMSNAGFSGPWAELKVSYRLPPKALEVARYFANNFLPQDTVDLPYANQGELDIFPCQLRWVHTSVEKAPGVCIEEILNLAKTATSNSLAISDITFLTNNQKHGMLVVNGLGRYRINVVHTYSEDQLESRRKKMGFYMGDAKVKATTLHSFKGWESRSLVIYIGERATENSLALIYVGLTRLKRHVDGSYLTVISCAEKLKEYGKSWNYSEI